MNRRSFVKSVGAGGGLALLGASSAAMLHLRPAYCQVRSGARPAPGEQAIPREVTALYARAIVRYPERARQWIYERGRYVADTPGAEDSAAFQSSVKQYSAQLPNSDVMTLLFLVFKQAVELTASDKANWMNQLADANRVNQELSDYLGYLAKASSNLSGKNDADAVCEAGRIETQSAITRLRALQTRLGATTPLRSREPRTIGELETLISKTSSDLRRKVPELRKSIETITLRLESLQARYRVLYPKMTEAVKKVPSPH